MSKHIKLAFAIFIIFVGFLGSLYQNNQKTLAAIKTPVALASVPTNNTDFPKRIEIPDLGINISIKYSKIVNGYWEVFDHEAGYGEGSGLPGQPGNQVIFAHKRVGLFLPLLNAQKDMLVSIYGQNKKYDYKITEIKKVNPLDISVVAPTKDETLTLYTCTGIFDQYRLVVVAKRV